MIISVLAYIMQSNIIAIVIFLIRLMLPSFYKDMFINYKKINDELILGYGQ